ncbi:hypothetical protein AB0M28_07060 [Streptomyces sp. NPDC051940]|uniref:hypothetical protein n=1 Tax=Streptomyces sp. NPDC051940 TaxID=3155675 RepID=UPI00344A5B63
MTAPLPDALAVWLGIRGTLSWPRWPGCPRSPSAPTLDGFHHFFLTTRGGRDPEGTARVRAALEKVQTDAARGTELSLSLVQGWQQIVLNDSAVGFRALPAFAKGGRERYGLNPHTRFRFEECLAETTQPGLPLPSRAARAYLDVLFFHPFGDGVARAAMLVLAFVLASEGVTLSQVHPLQATRWADDAEGAVDLAILLGILITESQRRLTVGSDHIQRGNQRPSPRRTP